MKETEWKKEKKYQQPDPTHVYLGGGDLSELNGAHPMAKWKRGRKKSTTFHFMFLPRRKKKGTCKTFHRKCSD